MEVGLPRMWHFLEMEKPEELCAWHAEALSTGAPSSYMRSLGR